MAANETPEFGWRLSETQRQIVGTVRAVTQGEFRHRGLDYMAGTFPWENIRRLADLGKVRIDKIPCQASHGHLRRFTIAPCHRTG